MTLQVQSLSYPALVNNQLTSTLIIRNVSSSLLTHLSLDSDNLNGQIPTSLSNLSNLRILSVRSTNLSGHCNFGIFPELNVLDLSSNCLSGTLPQCLYSSLVQLNLGGNNFHGNMPEIWQTNAI
ncbi:LRR domain containing protein [Parasponia andersonii]|uniref:LRR domain containing protein n=1 Tax=Parasponia andersonii TaxID=3476 RepID=A0A2P5C5Z7_PARAD|nr:LRR domain containing protein [Parasponia andersonii]